MFNNNKYTKSDYIPIFNFCVKYLQTDELISIITVYNTLLTVMFTIRECGKLKNDTLS